MKGTSLKLCTLTALAGLSAAATPGEIDVALAPGSALWLEGDSTLHAFSSHARRLQVRASGDLGRALVSGGPVALEVRVPVAALDSGDASLDQNLRAALRAEEHPEIVFRLGGYERAAGAADGYAIRATGTLRIAGRERPVVFAAAARTTRSHLSLEGKVELRMSDFGIEPPTMFFGALRTRDQVVVRFRLLIESAGIGPAASEGSKS